MKKILTILGILLSSFVYGQKFSYKVLYEGSNGDSLHQTKGCFKIYNVRKTNFTFKTGRLKILTDSLSVDTKITFLESGDGNEYCFDIGTGSNNPQFTRIIGCEDSLVFFLNDQMVYYFIMK
jgi:hypothetical protein